MYMYIIYKNKKLIAKLISRYCRDGHIAQRWTNCDIIVNCFVLHKRRCVVKCYRICGIIDW